MILFKNPEIHLFAQLANEYRNSDTLFRNGKGDYSIAIIYNIK